MSRVLSGQLGEIMGEFHNMSSFSRTVANEQKKGAYYTDRGMCRRIGRLLALPEKGEVSIVEPSIGDGWAVREVLDSASVKGKTTVFGVELDAVVAAETRKVFKELSAENVILEADFLVGTKISYTSFGLCFANPPYRKADVLNEESMETLFMKNIYPILKKAGVLVYVIPHYTLADPAFFKPFLLRFEPLSVYRFDDDVYAQFKQCVLIGRRRNRMADWSDEGMMELREKFMATVSDAQQLPYLPSLQEEIPQEVLITVPESPAKDIKYFTTSRFDYKRAGEALNLTSPLYKEQNRRLRESEFKQVGLNNPPVPMKKDLLYMCAISGGGQGYCGSEEEGDLHLQRGVVKTIKEDEVQPSEKGDGNVIVERTRSAVSMTILESDGTFHTLK